MSTTTQTTQTPRTIAQGLRRIKDLQGKLAQLDSKIPASGRWTKGEEPAYDFNDLLTQREAIVTELVTLRRKIAQANATNTVRMPDGDEVFQTEAVIRITELKGLITLYAKVPTQAKAEITTSRREQRLDESGTRYIAELVETTTVVAMAERTRAEKIEELQQELRLIDEALQDANHTTALPA